MMRPVIFLLLFVLSCLPAIGLAQVVVPVPALEARTLEVANRPIFEFRTTMFDISPEERMQRAGARVDALSGAELASPVQTQAVAYGQKQGVAMMLRGQILFVVYRDDLDPVEAAPLVVEAERVRLRLAEALRARQEQTSVHKLAQGLVVAIVATLAYLGSAVLLLRGRRRLLARVFGQLHRQRHDKLTWRWVALSAIHYGVALSSLLLQLALAYLWLAFVLQQFPYTRPWGLQLGDSLAQLLQQFASGVIAALPGLITVGLILLLTRMATRGLDFIFNAVASGRLTLPGLYSETVGATRRLLNVLLWAFALSMAYPYLPGSNSDAFRGISVFFGLMVSFGSAGIVSQAMSGLVLVYARALRPGDWVRIGETEGRVLELGALSTKLMNRLKQEVTLPNSVVVGGQIINSSRLAADDGMPLATKVTIGYDTPWRQVTAMLELAAARTHGVRRMPGVQVNQLGLQDFYIEYELVVRLVDDKFRTEALTALHGNIVDVFNEFGVQIMSPHFVAQPGRDILVPPSQSAPPPARSAV